MTEATTLNLSSNPPPGGNDRKPLMFSPELKLPPPPLKENMAFATVGPENSNTLQSAIDLLTQNAMKDISNMSEAFVQEALSSHEKMEIAKVKTMILAKAKTPEDKTLSEAKIAQFEQIYENEANATTVLKELSDLVQESSLDTSALKLSSELEKAKFNESLELQDAILKQLRMEAEKLGISAGNLEILMSGLNDTCGRITRAYDSLNGTKTTQDIYRALRLKMLLRVWQDKKSARVSVGNHGIYHLDWDTKVACKAAKDMGLSDLEQLYLDFAVDLHDVAYALPTISGKMQKGNFSIDQNHRILSAKIARTMMATDSYHGLFRGAKVLSVIEKLALYHDQTPRLNLHDPAFYSDSKILSCLIFADNAAVFRQDKLPNAITEAPEIFLPVLYQMRIVKENYRRFANARNLTPDQQNVALRGILMGIREDAKLKVKATQGLSEDQKEDLMINIDQLQPDSVDKIVGRMAATLTDKDPYGYNPTLDKMYIRFSVPPSDRDRFGQDALLRIFDRGVTEEQLLKLMTGFGVQPQEAKSKLLIKEKVQAAGNQVMIYLHEESQTPSQTTFETRAAETLQTLRIRNMQYEAVNSELRSLDKPDSDEQSMIKRLSDKIKGELNYLRLRKACPDFFLQNGLSTSIETMAFLSKPENRIKLKEMLLDRRAKMAERTINNS